jgi:hypothetical protein
MQAGVEGCIESVISREERARGRAASRAGRSNFDVSLLDAVTRRRVPRPNDAKRSNRRSLVLRFFEESRETVCRGTLCIGSLRKYPVGASPPTANSRGPCAFRAALAPLATRWLPVRADAAFPGIVSSVKAAICASRNLTAPSNAACSPPKASTSIPAASTCPASAGRPSAANPAAGLPFEAGEEDRDREWPLESSDESARLSRANTLARGAPPRTDERAGSVSTGRNGKPGPLRPVGLLRPSPAQK